MSHVGYIMMMSLTVYFQWLFAQVIATLMVRLTIDSFTVVLINLS